MIFSQSLELPLSLTNLEVAQKGRYKCEAQNVIGTTSQDASLSVLKIPKVNIITATTELAEYRRYALECEITNTDSQPTIQWIDHDKMILLTVSRSVCCSFNLKIRVNLGLLYLHLHRSSARQWKVDHL